MIQKTYYKTKDYAKVKFLVTLENAETVEVIGLNQDWENGIELKKKKDGSFSAEVTLPKNSRHEFKYKINNHVWMNEPEADAEQGNVYGGSNSVLILEN